MCAESCPPPLPPRVCDECGAVKEKSRVERGEGWIALHDWPFFLVLPMDGSPVPEKALTLCFDCHDKRKAGGAIAALQPYGG